MKKKYTFVDWVVLIIVVLNALVVITLSFNNTAKLADTLSLNPYLTAGLAELMFGTLLFIRGRQRSLELNVPSILSVGYFASFSFVTGVNMWGLAQEHVLIGPIVGATISGAMWLMENILVWLVTESYKPHEKTLKDKIKETKQKIKDEKMQQKIDWMSWEAKKPDLQLILKARKAEQKRKEILEEGFLPEYFNQQSYTASAYDDIARFLRTIQQKPAETTEINAENESEINAGNEVEKISDDSETSPATTLDTSSKKSQKNDTESAQKSEEKAVKKTTKSAKKAVRKSAKRTRRKYKKDREKEIQKATEVIKRELEETGEYPTHEAVAALARTTKYYAQEARKIFQAQESEEKQQLAS